MKEIFNFLSGDDETATGGDPEEVQDGPEEIATGGNQEQPLHQGLTKAQILEAQRQAESPRGLDMSNFMRKTGVPNLDFDQLLRFRVS